MFRFSNKLFIVSIIALILSGATAYPQSGFVKNMKQAFESKPKLVIGFDSRRSFLANRDIRITGAKVGIDLDHRFRTGVAMHGLTSKYERTFIVDNDTTQSALRFSYLSIWAEYVFFRNKRWEFSTPVYLGVGKSKYSQFEESTERPVTTVESALMGQYKFFPWIGLGAGVGYRRLLIHNPQLDENFSNFIYIVKLKIFLSPILDAVFPNRKNGEGEE